MKADPPPAVATIKPRSVLPSQISCATWDLGDGPDADSSTESGHIDVLEEVVES